MSPLDLIWFFFLLSSIQPVLDMDNGGLPEALVSGFGSSIVRSQVNGPLSAPTVSFTATHSVSFKFAPNPANQPGLAQSR